jgi:hypothetical protein
MSMFEFFIDFFPGINKANIRKNILVVNHGGRLWFKMITSHVDQVVDWFPNGSTLSRTSSSLKFQGSIVKLGQVVSM